MYLPGLPALARDLGVSFGAAETTVAAFLFGLAFGQLVYGPLADRHGRGRPPLLTGDRDLYRRQRRLRARAVASRCCIALRGAAGAGRVRGDRHRARGGARPLRAARERQRLRASSTAGDGASRPILAPLAGGYVVVVTGWRSIFWLLAGFGVLVGAGRADPAAARRGRRASRPMRRRSGRCAAIWRSLRDRG